MGYVREATPHDVMRLANNLRVADQEELYGATGESPKSVFTASYNISTKAYAIVCNCSEVEIVAGMFGVREIEGNGVIWMVASDLLTTKHHSKKFIRQTKKWIDILNKEYPLLFNLVDKRNEVHIRWLKWSGFVLLKEKPWGAFGLPFIEFARINKCA